MIDALGAPPARRAVIAVAVLATILAALLASAVAAWLSLARQEVLLEDRRFDLASIAGRVKARGPGLARAERTLATDPFLPGATPVLAVNALQRRIVGLAEETGITLRTIGGEPGPAPEAGALPTVTLQASARAPIAALQKFLYRIETEAPFVLVDEVGLRAPTTGADRRVGSADPELEIEIRLIGYLRRRES
jgi:general secretion pathway protein M